jgi:hypothetical protein
LIPLEIDIHFALNQTQVLQEQNSLKLTKMSPVSVSVTVFVYDVDFLQHNKRLTCVLRDLQKLMKRKQDQVRKQAKSVRDEQRKQRLADKERRERVKIHKKLMVDMKKSVRQFQKNQKAKDAIRKRTTKMQQQLVKTVKKQLLDKQRQQKQKQKNKLTKKQKDLIKFCDRVFEFDKSYIPRVKDHEEHVVY